MGAGIGIIISKWAVKENYVLDMMFHEYLAMAMMLIFAMGATTGFILLKNDQKNEKILKYHKILNGVSLLIFIILGVSGFYEITML